MYEYNVLLVKLKILMQLSDPNRKTGLIPETLHLNIKS